MVLYFVTEGSSCDFFLGVGPWGGFQVAAAGSCLRICAVLRRTFLVQGIVQGWWVFYGSWMVRVQLAFWAILAGSSALFGPRGPTSIGISQ
jgi:hypothetical protein